MITAFTACASNCPGAGCDAADAGRGKYRQIMVDIDPASSSRAGLTPLDVNAVNAQNLTLPSGTAKMGDTQYTCAEPTPPPASIADLNDIPIKSTNGATIFVRDVGQVHDGWLVQQNIVREDGRRSVLLSVIKNGNASTLNVVNGVRNALKTLRAAAPCRNENLGIVRSIGVRDEFGGGCGARGRYRRRADGTDDPAVPGIVAVDPGGHDLDTARPSCHPLVVLFFLGHTLNTMAPWRPRARGRHPGRRLDGDD